MVLTKIRTIVDGDGHIWEDDAAIIRHLPPKFASMYHRGNLFPQVDHLHIAIGRTPEGAFQMVGAEGWRDFMHDLGLRGAVLYPSHALSYGRIANRDWALAVTHAYNEWLYQTYL